MNRSLQFEWICDPVRKIADTTLCGFLKTVDPERLRTVTRDFSALTRSIAVASTEFDKALAIFTLGRAFRSSGAGRTSEVDPQRF
jgi:hypothetical protein